MTSLIAAREKLALLIAPWLYVPHREAREEAFRELALVAYRSRDAVWTSPKVLVETALNHEYQRGWFASRGISKCDNPEVDRSRAACPNCGSTEWTLRMGLGRPKADGSPGGDYCNVCEAVSVTRHQQKKARRNPGQRRGAHGTSA